MVCNLGCLSCMEHCEKADHHTCTHLALNVLFGMQGEKIKKVFYCFLLSHHHHHQHLTQLQETITFQSTIIIILFRLL